jgi:hypothetical protein
MVERIDGPPTAPVQVSMTYRWCCPTCGEWNYAEPVSFPTCAPLGLSLPDAVVCAPDEVSCGFCAAKFTTISDEEDEGDG